MHGFSFKRLVFPEPLMVITNRGANAAFSTSGVIQSATKCRVEHINESVKEFREFYVFAKFALTLCRLCV